MSQSGEVVVFYYNDKKQRIPLNKGHLMSGYPYFEQGIEWILKSYPECKGKPLYELVDGIEFQVWPAAEYSGWSLNDELK